MQIRRNACLGMHAVPTTPNPGAVLLAGSLAAAACRSHLPTLTHNPPPASTTGISHNQRRFKAAADRCLAEFDRLFGGSPLQSRPLEPGYGPPPRCALLHFDCMYLE